MRMGTMSRRAAIVMALLIGAAPFASAAEKSVRRATRVEPVTAASLTYKLTEHDVVNIVVFGEDELNTTTRIGKDGQINMPMVGLVRIVGQNIREASKTLETALFEYLKKPQVSVTIVQYTKRKITILGQVNKPGTYDLPDETSVNIVEAIGMAGGYTRIANTKITIKRTVNGREQTIKVDAKSAGEGDATERLEVLPGDTINVGERLF